MNSHFSARPLISAFLLASALATTAHAEGQLTWTGCGISKTAFMGEMATAYEKKTGTKIVLSGGGATKGIRSTAAGTNDLGGSCRSVLHDANGQVHPEEAGAELIHVAWDALVVITHADNPVKNISMADLKKVFDGEITNWSQLGGDNKPIALVEREGKDSGVGNAFRRLVFNDENYEFKARAIEEKSTGPLEKRVAAVKTSIAIDGVSSARKTEVKMLSIDGIEPTKENIANGKYPLFRPLFISVNKERTSDQTKDFVKFVLSDEGQAVISKEGTVNIKEGSGLVGMWETKTKTKL